MTIHASGTAVRPLSRPAYFLLRLRRSASGVTRRGLVRLRESELALIAIAALIGFAVGCGVVLIGLSVAFLHHLLFGVAMSGHLSDSAALAPAAIALVPALGGLLVGLVSALIRRYRPREIVDSIEANALYGGRMSLLDSLNLALLTILAVGFGGSAGLEAAYTQAGSGLSSKIGQSLRLRRQDLRILVGCGAAAAIAAAFNSPLAGAFYAFELVIGSYSLQSLAPVASAALCGSLAYAAIEGGRPMFVAPGPIALETHDYALFVLLGLGAAAVSIATMRAVTIVENGLRQQRIPAWLRPALGGTAVGLVALLFPQVLGSGHGAISVHLQAANDVPLLGGLLIAKMLASALTVGSGMRGGLFSSSLLLGAIFGGVVAGLLAIIAPQLAVNPAAYSLVGMAAVAGGIVGAPVTMTLLVLETTGNFSLTIGVMAGVIASTVAVRHAFGYSFATWRFHVRGMRLQGAYDVGWIAELTAEKLMRRDPNIVSVSDSIGKVRERFPVGGPKYAFVVNAEGTYLGTIETIEAHSPSHDGELAEPAATLIRGDPAVLTPDANIQSALTLFKDTASEVLPVVNDRQSRRILGYVSEAYVLRRYTRELEKHRAEEVDGGVFSPKVP